ncbi:NADPH:quinone oxidoreductase family protein [Sulfitobacter sp. LCG007]
MRALQVTGHGEPLTLSDIDRPEPGPGQVQVKVETCGLNFADLLMIEGSYQERPPLPFTLGMELCGKVSALGEGVEGVVVGQRIASYCGMGALADYAVIPAELCVPIPDVMTDVDAAAFLIAYGTSHVALDYKAHLQSGERLLVLGASGGVGLTAVELGKLMGAEVIAVARGRERLSVARDAGADHLICSETEDIREAVLALGGADVVYDPVGGAQFSAAMRACNPEARLIPLGFASGDVPQIKANHLLVKNLTVIGFYWGGYMRFRPSVLTDSFRRLIEWYVEGRIRPHVSHVLPLEQGSEALDLLRTRKATGKVVVKLT